MPLDLLIRNTSEVITATGTPSDDAEIALAPIAGAAIGIEGTEIRYLGSPIALPERLIAPTTRIIDAKGGFVGPGFVDPHTHLVFAGDRSDEFELRCQGASYAEIAASGGGIANTVRATRQASKDQLIELALPRLGRMLDLGVTHAEIKSGYGLNLEDELKILSVIGALNQRQPIALLPTLLCAHAIPKEYQNRRQEYVDLCVRQILPAVAEARLATYCDVFVDAVGFRHDEARAILEAARAHGFKLRIHADQLTPDRGAELAAELKALSADHLDHTTIDGARALARSGVSAVLVPTSTLFLKEKIYARGRVLREAGVNVAIATNLNPGSAMSESLPLAIGLACLMNGLTAAEAYWGATRGGAIALGLPEAGTLFQGGPADLVVFDCSNYRHLPYHFAINHAAVVIKAGKVVANRPVTSLCE